MIIHARRLAEIFAVAKSRRIASHASNITPTIIRVWSYFCSTSAKRERNFLGSQRNWSIVIGLYFDRAFTRSQKGGERIKIARHKSLAEIDDVVIFLRKIQIQARKWNIDLSLFLLLLIFWTMEKQNKIYRFFFGYFELAIFPKNSHTVKIFRRNFHLMKLIVEKSSKK